ncbi:MAG TPA: putative quinol monooxygenase [Mycobacteriales bacterium]|jgi:quinol monooxygenase YgiN|nr:putative quinol monooxygenase [Mycobacteriales bacterium]
MTYGYIGSMKTKPGHREDVVGILLEGVDWLRDAGCELYLVGRSDTDPDVIWVSEVWRSKAHHDASLQMPKAKAAIGKAVPLLTGQFTSQEVTVAGGLGVAAHAPRGLAERNDRHDNS